jgi:hypothetical protein
VIPRSRRERGFAFGTLRIPGIGRLTCPRARPGTLPAARGNGSHQRLFAIKEQGFHVATLDRPLTSRTAILLEREQRELRLSCRFSLFASKLEDFFPSVALAIDHDEGRRHSQVSATNGASRFAISRFK